jgi:hypothetical protein
MITIELGNIGSEKQALRIREKLEGKTYMEFIVEYGICAGNYPVTVSTNYEGVTMDEFRNMLGFVMACEM